MESLALSGVECVDDILGYDKLVAAEKTLGTNGADGISNIEGKVTRVGASECGQRASFNRRRWETGRIFPSAALTI
jgi:hypothetical protein